MPNDNLKKYYDYLKANNADVAPNYDAFANALSDENNAKKYHSYLLNNGFDAPKDYNVFVNRLGLVKKKEVSQSTPKNGAVSSVTQEMVRKKRSEYSSPDDGIYSNPENNQNYKKVSGVWYKDVTGAGDYKEIKSGNVKYRYDYLNKNAKMIADINGNPVQPNYELANQKQIEKAYNITPEKVKKEEELRQKEIAKKAPELKQFKPAIADGKLFNIADKEQEKEFEKAHFEYVKSGKYQEDVEKVQKENDLNDILNTVTSDLVGSNEDDVISKLQNKLKKYDYLQIEPAGLGYDGIKIKNNVTGESKFINLDNWTTDRDNEEAKLLKGFLEVNIVNDEYIKKQKQVNDLRDRIESEKKTNPYNVIFLQKELDELLPQLDKEREKKLDYMSKDKYRSAAAFDKYEIDRINDNITKTILKKEDIKREASELNKYEQDVNESFKKGLITEEDYNVNYLPKINKRKEEIDNNIKSLKDDYRNISNEQSDVKNIAGNAFIVESERGNILSGTAFSFVQGFEQAARIIVEGDEYARGSAKGIITSQFAPESFSEEYLSSEKRNAFEQVVFGLANSGGAALAGAMTGGPVGSTLGLYASSYTNFRDQMNGPEFKDVSEGEKMLLAGSVGAITSLLEKYGLTKMFSKSPVNNKIINYVFSKSLKNLASDATAEMIDNAVEKEIKGLIANKVLKITGAGLIEYSTEAGQELTEIGAKELLNQVKGKKYFENPKTFGEVFERANKAGLLGLLGGAGMQSITQATLTAKQQLDKYQLSNIENTINNKDIKDLFVLNIKDRILSGEITKDQGQAELNSLKESEGVLRQIPDNLSNDDRYTSFKLINERENLRKQMEGKDPALVTPISNRINEINNELKTISENAVQVETTGEIPVQPETRVGGEMEEGKPQAEPQVVTEEGEAAVQEEVTPIENKDVQEVLDRRKPMILSESDQKRMDEDPIGFTKEKLENLIDFVESKKDRSSVDEDMLQQYKRDYEILTSQQVEETPIVQTIIREVPQQNLVTEENVEQLKSQQTTPNTQRIFTTAKLAMKALPGVKIYVHNTTNEFDQAIGQKSAEGAKGAYVDGEIHINLENGADVVTMLHESMHHGLVVKGVESGAMTDLARGLKSVISDKALKQRLDDFISNYDGSEQAEEYLAELGGIMAEAKQELTTTKFQQFKNLINKIAQKLGLPTVFSAAANAKNAVDFMNSLTKSIRTGQEIKAEEVKKTGKVKFQADFSDPLSKLTFVYDKNGEKFDQLKKDGFITDDKVLSDFAGKFIFLHQPDAAFSGMIYKDGELLVEGKGGVFYPIKFHDDGYFWASTATTAEKMAKDLNKVFDQNNGTIYMALTSAPYDKLMSSTTMSNAILDFFSSKAFDNNFKITPAQLKVALRKAANDIKIQKIKDKKTGKVKEKKIGLDLKIKAESSLDEIQAQIKTALNPDIKSFADRKNFAEELIKLMADKIKNDPKATEQFGKLFSEGIQNKYFKGISKTGKISISAANMTQAISEMFTEPLLKEDIDREKGGQVYAIVELNGKVKPEPSTKHESYPMAIESENKTNKVKIHILQDRQNWADSFIDPETGETISEDRQKKLFPTSGVSTMGLELKGKPKFQKGETKESKINIYGQDFTDLFKELGIPFEYLADIKDKNIPDFLGGKNKKITELRDSLLKSINYRLDLLKEDLEKQSRKITNSDSDFEFRRSLINKKTDKVLSLERLKSSIEENLLSESDIEISIGNKPSKPKFQKTAPNGKPSNLNDKQWEQVRTPEFKKWFGDWENDPANASKVVDENGEPLVVYHGSLGEFDEFETQLLGSRTGSRSAKKGFFFSDDKRVADSYIYFGQLQNPNIDDLKPIIYGMTREQLGDFQSTVLGLYDDSDSYSDEDLEYLKDDIFGAVEYDSEQHMLDSLKYIEKAEKFIKSRNINKEFSAYPKGYIYESFLNIKNPFEQDLNNDVFDDTYTLDVSNKNDGIILTNAIDSFSAEEKSGGIESTIIVAFEPNQIKSATENVGTFSAETRNIKFQKATTQKEAIQKAKDKYTLSVEQRGNPHQQGVDAALNDLRKSDWYKTTDDTQRENAERELKEFFGEKLKKAPSVAKVLGKPKAKQVSVNEMSALKDQIRLEAKAAREAKADLNSKRKMLAAAISGMVKLGKVKASQAAVLVKRVSNLNLDNPVMVERFTNYAQRVFERADYQDRLSKAFEIRKGIRKDLKTDNQAEVVGMAKAFTKIDPSLVEDIDAYMEMAEKVKNAVKPSREKGLDAVMKEAANIAEISEYTNEEIARQEDIQRNEFLATYDFLDNEMSLEEMQKVIDALKDPTIQMDTTEKQKYVKDYLNGRFGIMSSILESMFKTGIDPMTGEEITFDEKQKELIKRALKIDLNEMSVREAIKIVESLENFLTNQITSGLEAAVSSYEGAMNDKQLVQKGFKARELKLFASKKVGRVYNEQAFPLALMIERMFQGTTRGTEVMVKWGLTKLINGVNKSIKQLDNSIKEFSKQDFYSSKDFMDAENVYEAGMLAELIRTVNGTPAEMKAEFDKKVNKLKQSINILIKKGNSREKQMGEIYQKVYDKLNVDSMDIDVIKSNASKENLDAVNWWINEWSRHYSDLYDINLAVYNAELSKDLNYTSSTNKKLSSKREVFKADVVERGGSYAMEFTDKNKAGVLIEPTRSANLAENRYINLDFYNNQAKALKAALVDINTASAIRQIDGFMNSEYFDELIPSSEDREIIVRRVNSYIRKAKGKNIVPSDTIQDVDRFLNFVATLGVGKALGGISQSVTQSVPVILNTIRMTGRFDVAGPDFNAWLDKLGTATANRGLESESNIDSIDRKLEAKGKRAQQALKFAEKVSQMYLKLFLSKTDIFVARSSFKSYYLQNLKRRGISIDIDWKTHEPDMEAVEYAEAMVNRQQNVSDPMLAGEFLSSDDPGRKITRKMIFPFTSYILNQKARMYNDLLVISSKTSTNEDVNIAKRSLSALAVELLAFHIAGFAVRAAYDGIASWWYGKDDEDEEKKKLFGIEITKNQYNATKYPVKSIANDILSPIPGISDNAVTWSLNTALSIYPWMDDKEIKDAVKERNKILELKGENPMDTKTEAEYVDRLKNEATYQVFEDENDRNWGMYGIASDTYKELYDVSKLATTGEFTDEYQGREITKKLLDADRKRVLEAIAPILFYATGALPKDVGSVSKKFVNKIKKQAVTEKQYERYETVQKDLGRNLKSWEIQLVKDKKESETAISEIEFIERNGGLTERQGREYLKLMKAIGEPKVSDIVKIKEGQTADQILK